MDEVSCVLCEKRAMMLCDSDQAKLCWDCDEKVHSANFLVAKHSRVLLCRFCHSPTPWTASGTKLTPTVSFCHRCVVHRHARFNHLLDSDQRHRDSVNDDEEHRSDHVLGDDDSDYSEEEEEDDDDDEEDEEEDEEGENQVVPMSSGSDTSPPGDYSGLALKRLKNNSFSFDSHDDTECSSSEILSTTLPNNDESSSRRVLGALKRHRIDERNC